MIDVKQSLAHTTWNCKYHIVFAPKYRRKVFYKEKRKENPRSRGMPRPCAYALGDTAQSKRIQFHGVSQREEQSNDLRKVPGIEIQVSEQGVLVPWVLRRHGREKCKKDRGVHPSSVGRR